MRIGIIDLGTNSVRFDIHVINKKHQARLLHREKLMIRLGQRVFLNGKLDSHAIQRAVQAFISFHRTANTLRAEKVLAFGTSALREAVDSERLIEQIRKKTQIDVRIISGTEEAQLIALGILKNEKLPKGRFGLIDIGGGSTEISICHNKEILLSESFPLGTARIQQVFLKSSPPKNSIKNLRNFIQSTLQNKFTEEKWPKANSLIGSSGTIRALEKILKKQTGKDGIHRKDLKRLIDEMSTLNRQQLLLIPGMEAKRVDMILAGAILLDECLIALGATHLKITNFSLRDGILTREIQQATHPVHFSVGFELNELNQKIRRFGLTETQIRQMTQMADRLFEKTKRVHRLHSEWKRYFIAATLLRRIGEAISPIHFEAHSYYIVKNADFSAMDPWQSEFLAQLCLKQNVRKLSKKDLTFTQDKTRRQAFIKIAALLSLIEAFSHKPHPEKVIKTIVRGNQIHLFLLNKSVTELEILRLEQRKTLFESVFQKTLWIKRV